MFVPAVMKGGVVFDDAPLTSYPRRATAGSPKRPSNTPFYKRRGLFCCFRQMGGGLSPVPATMSPQDPWMSRLRYHSRYGRTPASLATIRKHAWNSS
jgi:hypothetical protein